MHEIRRTFIKGEEIRRNVELTSIIQQNMRRPFVVLSLTDLRKGLVLQSFTEPDFYENFTLLGCYAP